MTIILPIFAAQSTGVLTSDEKSMELNVVDIFKIANRLGLCYMVEEFDGWESIKSFTATGKAHGEFIICERDMLKPVILTIPRYIGFIAIPASELPNGTSDRKETK